MLEIGCHEGSDTVKFLREMPRIILHCFDCEQRALERFKVRISAGSVFLWEKAVADIDGSRAFYASTGKAGRREDWDLSGSLHKPTGHLTRSPEIKFKDPKLVPCMRLDTWWNSCSQPSVIDFIWADVQGSQRLVIEGGKGVLARTKYLYIESHDPVAYAGEPAQEELVELLAEWFVPVARYARENILFCRKLGGLTT